MARLPSEKLVCDKPEVGDVQSQRDVAALLANLEKIANDCAAKMEEVAESLRVFEEIVKKKQKASSAHPFGTHQEYKTVDIF